MSEMTPMTESTGNSNTISFSAVIETMYYYLSKAEYENEWADFSAAGSMHSLLPFEWRDTEEGKKAEAEFERVHNKLREEDEKEYERGHWVNKYRPKKSHGKGNRPATKRLLEELRETYPALDYAEVCQFIYDLDDVSMVLSLISVCNKQLASLKEVE